MTEKKEQTAGQPPVNRSAVYSMDVVKAYFATASSLFPKSTATVEQFVELLREEGFTIEDGVN